MALTHFVNTRGAVPELERRFLYELFELLQALDFKCHLLVRETLQSERQITVPIGKKNYELSIARLRGPKGDKVIRIACPDDSRVPIIEEIPATVDSYTRVVAVLRQLKTNFIRSQRGWKAVEDATIRRINS